MAAKARGVPLHLVLLAPAVLLGYFAFNAGGFFPRPPAFALIAIAQVLVLYVALSPHPLARLGWPAGTAVGARSGLPGGGRAAHPGAPPPRRPAIRVGPPPLLPRVLLARR